MFRQPKLSSRWVGLLIDPSCIENDTGEPFFVTSDFVSVSETVRYCFYEAGFYDK